MSHAIAIRRGLAEWLPAERLGGCRIGEALRPWLIGQGLLTERLRAKFADRFELRTGEPWTGLLQGEERAFLGAPDTAGLVREDELRVDGRTWAVSRVLMPDTTLGAHPWLAELGDSALLETLVPLSGVARGPYEYAWLSADVARVRAWLGDGPAAGLWARRTRVSLRSAPLAVEEWFLPAAGGA